MHRFFISPKQIQHSYFEIIDPKAIKYIRNILRLSKGEIVELFDSEGSTYQAKLELISRDLVNGKIITSEKRTEDRPYLILAQALPRAGKLDDIVKNNTEVGVSQFLLFESEYSQVKIHSYNEQKVARYQRIAIEAAKQSERAIVPEVKAPITFEQVLSSPVPLKILLHSRQQAGSKNIYQIKPSLAETQKALLIVGPEGGFSPNELKLAKLADCNIVYLDLPILRTETAGVVASGILLS